MTPSEITAAREVVERISAAKPATQNPVFIAGLLRDARGVIEKAVAGVEALQASEATLVARVQELERKKAR